MSFIPPELRRELAAAARVPGGIAVLTGAGMSAESGIPTFRDAFTGHWARLDPMELASEAGFAADPQRVWDWYAERRESVRNAMPNAGHQALAAFARRRPGVMVLATQNVDDLHQRAGQPQVLRLHGDILEDRWLRPCPRRAGCAPSAARPGRPPRCAECANPVRPGVVWFGEALPAATLDAAESAVESARVALVVGTSGVVWPAAGLVSHARRSGATVVIVNPHASEIDGEAHFLVAATAAVALPALLDEL